MPGAVMYVTSRAGLVASAARCLANQGLQRKSGLLSDVSLNTGGGMLEVQMETSQRMVQDVAVLTDGDFESVERFEGHLRWPQRWVPHAVLRRVSWFWRFWCDAALRVCQTFSPFPEIFDDCSLAGRMPYPLDRAIIREMNGSVCALKFLETGYWSF